MACYYEYDMKHKWSVSA